MDLALRILEMGARLASLRVRFAVARARSVASHVLPPVRQMRDLGAGWLERCPQLGFSLPHAVPDVPMVEREPRFKPAAPLIELQHIKLTRLAVSERKTVHMRCDDLREISLAQVDTRKFCTGC